MKNISLILAVCLALGLIGCSDETLTPDAPLHGANTTPGPLANIGSIHYGSAESDSPSERSQILGQIVEAYADVSRALKDASSWPEADQRLQEALAEMSEERRVMAEQVAAIAMLRLYLEPENLSEPEQETAARYTTLLVEHESPEAETILSGIQRSRDALTPSEIRDLAQRASTVAQNYLTEQTECPGCSSDEIEAMLRVHGTDETDQFQSAIAIAARELAALATE